MKKRPLILWVWIFVLLFYLPLSAITASGTITKNETWSDTVNVTGDVMITKGTLTIMPGTVVRFAQTNDSVVYGTSNQIYLVAEERGAIAAAGDPANRITFTSGSAAPTAGAWGCVQIVANGNNSRFSYCDFLYCLTGLYIANGAGPAGTSQVTVSECRIRYAGSNGIFIDNGNSVAITGCTINDCGGGIFLDGAAGLVVDFSYIYDVPHGIVLVGKPEYTTTASIDHLTLYNVDVLLSPNPQWWTGYGMYFTNTGYSVSITNSIFYRSTLANMLMNSWAVNEHHNCWDTGILGRRNIEDGTPDTTDLVGDKTIGNITPLFTDAVNDDLRLMIGCPCLNAGDDGTNMGAWQGVYYTINAQAGAHGSISPVGMVFVSDGQNKTFTMEADSGYMVNSIIVDGLLTDSTDTYTFTDIGGNHTIRVEFTLASICTITAVAQANGAISPTGTVLVSQGAGQSFTITPDSGYVIDSVLVDNVMQGTDPSYTFSSLQGDHTIKAVFRAAHTYVIMASAGPRGSIFPCDTVLVMEGRDITFTISPAPNNKVDSVIVDNVVVDSTASYTFNNVSSDHTIRVVFKYYVVYSGEITSDVTWSDTIIVDNPGLTVKNCVLTILPGTVIKINDDFMIEGGAVRAIGTEQDPILFSYKGYPLRIHLYSLSKDTATIFQYCIFENGVYGIEMRNRNITAASDALSPIIDHCTFRHSEWGIVGDNTLCNPIIRNCNIYDIYMEGIYLRGPGSKASISYCYIHDVSCGITIGGYNSRNFEIDHITIHGVDFNYGINESRTSRARYFAGHAIHSEAVQYTGLTNSIISDVAFGDYPGIGLYLYAGGVTNDYNCWYQAGYRNIVGADTGAHCMEADPMFVNPDSGDFTLSPSSPCWNAASDGSHIGAWQRSVGIADDFRVKSALLSGLDLQGKMYDLNGKMILEDHAPAGIYILYDEGERAARKTIFIR